MSMQLVRRRVGQVLRIQISSDLDPSTSIGEVLAKPIGLMLIQADADSQLAVYADERLEAIEEKLVREA